METFREIHFEKTMLRVYCNGEIWRWMKSSKDWKQIGSLNPTTGYYRVHLNYKMYEAHRIIAMVYLGLDITDTKRQVDHIDRCKTNNNVNNLRLVSNSQNHFNIGAKGYNWVKQSQKWLVRIKLNGKNVYSKYWKEEEDAAADYIKQKPFYHKID